MVISVRYTIDPVRLLWLGAKQRMDFGTFWAAAAIPLLILIARIFEASLESVRTIYISKGHANLAAYVGIVKTGVWLISTGLVLTNLTQFWNLFSYLAGYGIGTVLGMEIENLISIGFVIVRLITAEDPQIIMTRLSALGYGMTRIEGTGSFSGSVSIIFMIVPRKSSSSYFRSSPANTRIYCTPLKTSGISRTAQKSSIRIQNAVS